MTSKINKKSKTYRAGFQVGWEEGHRKAYADVVGNIRGFADRIESDLAGMRGSLNDFWRASISDEEREKRRRTIRRGRRIMTSLSRP